MEDTRNLFVAAQGTQYKLAASAQNVLSSMTKLVENVKLGVAPPVSVDNQAQDMLLMTAKKVATALAHLINSIKISSGKPPSDPTMDTFKVSVKTMVAIVLSLLETFQSVEDETSPV